MIKINILVCSAPLQLPERGRIEMVAESMEEIRQLMNKLSNPEPIKRGKKV